MVDKNTLLRFLIPEGSVLARKFRSIFRKSTYLLKKSGV